MCADVDLAFVSGQKTDKVAQVLHDFRRRVDEDGHLGVKIITKSEF